MKKDSLLVEKNGGDAIHFNLWLSKSVHAKNTHTERRTCKWHSFFGVEKTIGFWCACGWIKPFFSKLFILSQLFILDWIAKLFVFSVRVALIFNPFSCRARAFCSIRAKSDSEVSRWCQESNYMQNLSFSKERKPENLKMHQVKE